MGMSGMLGKPQLGNRVTGERGGCSRALTSGREDSHPVMNQGPFCDRREAQQAISLRDVGQDPPLAGPSSQMGRAKRQQRPGRPGDHRERGGKKKSKMYVQLSNPAHGALLRTDDKILLGSFCT